MCSDVLSIRTSLRGFLISSNRAGFESLVRWSVEEGRLKSGFTTYEMSFPPMHLNFSGIEVS
jgi:hypothetical protein